MKIICILIVILAGLGIANAQNPFLVPSHNGYYLKLTYGNGTHLILGLSFHHVNKKGFSMAGQYVIENRDARNVPADFKAGGFFGGAPFVSINSGSLLVGKVLEDSSKFIQTDLRAGINFGFIERPVNFKPQPTGGAYLFSPDNYSYDFEKKKFIGIVFNPTVNFNLTRVFGLSAGARANINHQDIAFGYEVGLIFGYLRGKRRKT